jgi:ribose 5-phosphate isomerase B
MKIAIGADHGGYELKESIKRHLKEKNVDVVDCGTNSNQSVDYPDFALAVGDMVAKKEVNYGVLVCTTGIGQGIAANKISGVRAATCLNEDQAKYSKLHNDANVISFGAKYSSEDEVKKMLDVWLATSFEGGRHQRRVDKIDDIEKKYLK